MAATSVRPADRRTAGQPHAGRVLAEHQRERDTLAFLRRACATEPSSSFKSRLTKVSPTSADSEADTKAPASRNSHVDHIAVSRRRLLDASASAKRDYQSNAARPGRQQVGHRDELEDERRQKKRMESEQSPQQHALNDPESRRPLYVVRPREFCSVAFISVTAQNARGCGRRRAAG